MSSHDFHSKAPKEWDDPVAALHSHGKNKSDDGSSAGGSMSSFNSQSIHKAAMASPLGKVAIKAAVERRASQTGQQTMEQAARRSSVDQGIASGGARRGSVSDLVLSNSARRGSITSSTATSDPSTGRRGSITAGLAGMSITGSSASPATGRRGSVTGNVSATVMTVEKGHLHVREESAWTGVQIGRKELQPGLDQVLSGFGAVNDASNEGKRLMKIAWKSCLDKQAGELIQLLNVVLNFPPENRNYALVRDAIEAARNPSTRNLKGSFNKFVDEALNSKSGYHLPHVIKKLEPHVEERGDIFAARGFGAGRTKCMGCLYCNNL